MHALVQTIAFRGIDTIPVDVQVHIANGLPTIAIVGLADKAIARACAGGFVIDWTGPATKTHCSKFSTGRCGERRRAFRFTHRAWLVDSNLTDGVVVSPDMLCHSDINAEAIISRATIGEALAYRAMPLLA